MKTTNHNSLHTVEGQREAAKILTLVIPTYNMEKYLDYCLTSLIMDDRELMKQLEVLVVNDGSKDSSSKIGHSYQDKYPETFRVIDKENGNYGSCVNRGLKEATGKYIKVLDADDSFDTEGLCKLMQFLRTADVDLILTEFIEVNEERIPQKKWNVIYPENVKMDLGQMLSYPQKILTMHLVTYRTQLLRDISYFQPEGISYTDSIWVDEPMASIKSAIYLPFVLYKYLMGRAGQTVDPKVAAKSVTHKIICAKTMIEVVSRTSKDDICKYRFVWNHALHSSAAIYRTFLLALDGLDLNDLKKFDADIKSLNEDLYQAIERTHESKFMGYKYLGKWRKRQKKTPIIIRYAYRYALKLYSQFLKMSKTKYQKL